ncbi:MAG: hypothetical protein NC331_16415 [Lachnospiraceae bacterium]|nr:hypothetical protein [Lachnospiraceae bacterium]MCM1240934.1 hypothetical protein [Lachnospiraceae bacterium]
MNRKANEQLMDAIGSVEEQYIREYMEAQHKAQGSTISERAGRPGKLRLTILLAALMIMLLGTVSIATVFEMGHFHANDLREQEVLLKNFDSIAATYAFPVGGLQECDGVKGTLNSVLVEDHHLVFSYTFDWSGLEEAQNGSFHTWFLPWFFYIKSGDTVICQSEYTMDLHTQTYPGDPEDEFSETFLYCIDLNDTEGQSLVGEELTVQLLYAEDGDGFTYTFTPETCFTDREWRIYKTYKFEEHQITLERLRESALYITLFIDCEDIGHAEDEYQFILSDELGNDYTVFPYEAEGTEGYWFTKPETVGSRLTLKIIRSNLASDSYGAITDDSYDVLYEIPIELKTSFWEKFR